MNNKHYSKFTRIATESCHSPSRPVYHELEHDVQDILEKLAFRCLRPHVMLT